MNRRPAPGLRGRVAASICIATVAGGALDAWSYVGHGGVFANAQSGNIVLMAADLASRRASAASGHALSLATFVAGLLLSAFGGEGMKRRGWNSRTVRLGLVAALLAILAAVADTIPDLEVAAAIGFVAAIFITSLSHVGRWSFNTGMTTGNMRSAARALAKAADGDRGEWPHLWLTLALCASFGAGAYLGALATPRLHGATALCIAVAVAVAGLLLARDPDPLPAWADVA